METNQDRNGSQDILAECSDEEEFGKLGVKCGNTWSPFPSEISTLYEQVAKKSLEFTWKWTGERSNPDDEVTTVCTPQQNIITATTEAEPEATDFDFEEEVKPTPHLSRFGKSTALKGGGKKKTSSLAGILSNMKRHRILDQAPKSGTKSQPSSIPRSTAS